MEPSDLLESVPDQHQQISSKADNDGGYEPRNEYEKSLGELCHDDNRMRRHNQHQVHQQYGDRGQQYGGGHY